MDYSHRVEQANKDARYDFSYLADPGYDDPGYDGPDYSDEPLQAVVDRQRDVSELQAREIMRLQEIIRELEREDTEREAGRVYDWNANVPADGASQG